MKECPALIPTHPHKHYFTCNQVNQAVEVGLILQMKGSNIQISVSFTIIIIKTADEVHKYLNKPVLMISFFL